jgi:hypothetical protein
MELPFVSSLPRTLTRTPKGMAMASYNGLKLRVLHAFAAHVGWMRPGSLWLEIHKVSGPRAGIWTYLARLWRWGLLRRRRLGGRLHYAITRKGRERLTWLESGAARTAGRRRR